MRKHLRFTMVIMTVLIATFAVAPPTSAATRIATGHHYVSFHQGDAVIGGTIAQHDNSYLYDCYEAHAPQSGRVIDGVINPWHGEINKPTCSKANYSPGPRKASGGTQSFGITPRRHNVMGSVITLQSGLTYYGCKFVNVGESGKVTNGVIDPYPAELRKLPDCHLQIPSPGPRNATGDGLWKSFNVSPRAPNVLGYQIETGGKTYYNCQFTPVTGDGRVNSGVINPYPGELGKLPDCKTVEAINGYRTASGDGLKLSFPPGVGVFGAYIELSTGEKYDVPCYIWQTDNHSGGFVISGVVSFGKDELKASGLPGCGDAQMVGHHS